VLIDRAPLTTRPVAERIARYALLALGAAALAWSLLPTVIALRTRAHEGGVYSGADGLFVGDQFQYFSWIRDAGEHGLASNLLSLAPSDHVFLHPMFTPSGLLWRAGIDMQVVYALWKPVAAGFLVAGFWFYCSRVFDDRFRAIAATVLALGAWPAAEIAARVAGLGSATDRANLETLAGGQFALSYLWGYLPLAIAAGLMPMYFLGLERVLDASRRRPGRSVRWYAAWTAAAGFFAAWLHPWQAEVLLVVTSVLLLPRMRRWRELGAVVLPVTATLLPVAGYFLLSEFDASWELAAGNNRAGLYPLWIVLATFAPAGALALIGALRSRAVDLQGRVLRIWPLAALLTYALLSPSVPFHALEGTSLPLAVLAVQAFPQRVGLAAVVAGLGLLAVLGALRSVTMVRDSIHAGVQAYVFTPGEAEAFRYLDRNSQPGGVLAPTHITTAVPAYTGRATWLGHPSWTPDFFGRSRRAEALFSGAMTPSAAATFATSTGARFVLSDCRHPVDLTDRLGPLVRPPARFGCARVYELRLAGSGHSR
jgi:hypothetical protein